MLAKQKGKELIQDVNIKSRYLNSNEARRLIVNPQNAQISISQSGKPQIYKQFHIDQLKLHQVQGNKITLRFDNGRIYEIQANQPSRISTALVHTKNVQLCNKFVEQNINAVPKVINYAPQTAKTSNLVSNKAQYQKTVHIPFRSYEVAQSQSAKLAQLKQKNKRQYKRMPFFISPADWKIDPQQGTLVLLNQEWKSNTLKIFAFVVKKFVTTGTFMGISFPVFAMKSESILQTYAKALAAAPSILTNTRDQLERFKQFTSLLWSFSLLQVAIVKPFNPVIGETFQADIGGGKYSAEQVSHHPPVSSFYYQKGNYKLHASLQLSASIGVNSGEGRFLGEITIQYDDKYWIKGKLPNGELSGILFGTTTFQAFGGSYIYDSRNLVLTYNLGRNDTFEGFLGFLNYETSKKFEEVLKDKQRFLKFKGYSQQQYSKVVSRFTAKYTQWVAFDNKIYQNFNDPALFPYEIQAPLNQPILKSDSRNRKDIQFLKQKQLQQSQQQKQRIQNDERFLRKLREENAK